VQVLALHLRIRVPEARSLKDKRRVVDSLLDRARSRFGVTAAEVGQQESHQVAELGFAVVSGTPAQCERVMERVEDLVWSRPDLEVTQSCRTWLE
jgi:uncharacterized protein YlxP (DUF503 family)